MQCQRKADEIAPMDCCRLILATERGSELKQCKACPHGAELIRTAARKEDRERERARLLDCLPETWAGATPAPPPDYGMDSPPLAAVPAPPPVIDMQPCGSDGAMLDALAKSKPKPKLKAAQRQAAEPEQDNPHIRALRRVGKRLHGRWINQGYVGLQYLRNKVNANSTKTQMLSVNGLWNLLYAQGLTVRYGGAGNRFKVLVLDEAWNRFMEE
ncbi:hypothetical protein [Oleidesulfovibrio sp.]|uniref:hypothetical protein n=1 Tax=Oleidesulfovibrio sp. TaxID=2909707 RepID=UPI003A84C2B6